MKSMSTFSYLIGRQCKNYIKNLVKNPGKLTLVIIVVLSIVLMGVSMIFGSERTGARYRDIGELGIIISGILLILFCLSIYTGLENGATFFRMQDVNLLFTAPVDSRKVLGYGICKQMGTNLFVALFIVYQLPNLYQMYGISASRGWIIFVAYLFFLLMTQFCSMVLYMLCYGNSRRKNGIKKLIQVGIIVLGMLLVNDCRKGIGLWEAILNLGDVLRYMPLTGWTTSIVMGILMGEISSIWLYVFLDGLFVVGISVYILMSRVDYYEDVLASTERISEAVQEAKSGTRAKNLYKGVKSDKLKQFGIRKGNGANAIFYKQLTESRRSGKFIFGAVGISQAAVGVLAAFVVKYGLHMKSEEGLLAVLAVVIYISLFLVGISKWALELDYHYIYMFPMSGIKKFIYSALEGIIEAVITSIIIFSVAGIILGANLIVIMAVIIAKSSFEIFLIGINLLSQRLTGGIATKGIFMLVYLFIIILFEVPGIVLSVTIVTSCMKNMGIILTYGVGLIGVSIWNLIITSLIGLSANKVFSEMEFNR